MNPKSVEILPASNDYRDLKFRNPLMTDDVIFPKTVWERQKFFLRISTDKGLTSSPLVSGPPKFCHKIRNLLFSERTQNASRWNLSLLLAVLKLL